MDHIDGQLNKYKNIILEGFDAVSAGGFTQVPNFILKSKELSVGAKLTYSMLLSYAWPNEIVGSVHDLLGVATSFTFTVVFEKI